MFASVCLSFFHTLRNFLIIYIQTPAISCSLVLQDAALLCFFLICLSHPFTDPSQIAFFVFLFCCSMRFSYGVLNLLNKAARPEYCLVFVLLAKFIILLQIMFLALELLPEQYSMSVTPCDILLWMYWRNRFFEGGSEDFLLATRSVTTNDRILKTEGCSKTSALKSQYQRYAYFIWCMV